MRTTLSSGTKASEQSHWKNKHVEQNGY